MFFFVLFVVICLVVLGVKLSSDLMVVDVCECVWSFRICFSSVSEMMIVVVLK